MDLQEKLEKALEYAGHRGDCDALGPMWHLGPCDCGWTEAKKQIDPCGDGHDPELGCSHPRCKRCGEIV